MARLINIYWTDIFTFYLSVFVYTASATLQSMKLDEIETSTFDVKPGAGRQQFSRAWDGFDCTFYYKAQGGTKEEWSLSVLRNSDRTELQCVVERPGGHSYLFFEEFKLQVAGANLKQVIAERAPGQTLQSSEFTVVTDSNYVQEVSGKFNSQLSKVVVYATVGSVPASSNEL